MRTPAMDGVEKGGSVSGPVWGFVEAGAVAPAWNMAFDEALLLQASTVGVPVFRWYGWASPAATFGYFQKFAEIGTWTRIRPLLRRPTGGGLVPHLADWTYAFAVPPGHPWYALRAPESYERMHRWLERAFQECGLSTEVATCCEPTGPGQCFLGWEKFDLLHGGRKIAGAAQRRNQSGLLIQGSVQPVPGGVDREAFAAALRTVASRDWQVGWEMMPASRWEAQAQELVATRYEDEGYHRRR